MIDFPHPVIHEGKSNFLKSVISVKRGRATRHVTIFTRRNKKLKERSSSSLSCQSPFAFHIIERIPEGVERTSANRTCIIYSCNAHTSLCVWRKVGAKKVNNVF